MGACSGGDPSDSVATTAVAVASSTTTTTTTTTSPPPTTAPPTTDPMPGARDPACVVVVAAGDSLGRIASEHGLTIDDLRAENGLSGDLIHPDEELDICVGNDVDDVTGLSRLAPPPDAVEGQQTRLNALFAGYSIGRLDVDGDSGPLTRQMICAARIGLGFRASTAHLAPGSEEEVAIFDAESLQIPAGAATWAGHWAHVDTTCQVMFTGEGSDRVVDVFPVSTGQAGYETRHVAGVEAFRFDPALDNEGWHDSAAFPVSVDNPLNGNMYKPIYFNDGQAIHGGGYVPPEPRSKGCVRTFPWHQDRLIAWLGLDDLTEATWQRSTIGLVVTVVGQYRALDE